MSGLIRLPTKDFKFDFRRPFREQFPQDETVVVDGFEFKLPIHFDDIEAHIFSIGAPKAFVEGLLPAVLRPSSWYHTYEKMDPIVQFMFADVKRSSAGACRACYITVPAKPRKKGTAWGGMVIWCAGDAAAKAAFSHLWGVPNAQLGTVSFSSEGLRHSLEVQAADGSKIDAVGTESDEAHRHPHVQVWNFYGRHAEKGKDEHKIRGNDNFLRSTGSSNSVPLDCLKASGPVCDLVGQILNAATAANYQCYHRCEGIHSAPVRDVEE